MLAWGKKENGEDDVVVFTGLADWDGRRLKMLREGEAIFEVPREWWERIRVVDEDLRAIVSGAVYCISVTVGEVEDGRALRRTGLKWPKSDG